jgi:hypothetical protein
VTNKNVLCDIEVGEQEGLLVDRGDTIQLRFRCAAYRYWLSGETNLPAVGLIDSGHDLDERRFAGSVFTQQRMYLAGSERQRHRLQRLGGAEPLGDIAHFEDWRDLCAPARLLVAWRWAHRSPPAFFLHGAGGSLDKWPDYF